MLSFIAFLVIALVAIVFVVAMTALLLFAKGIDTVRRMLGLKGTSRSRFNWEWHFSDGTATQHGGNTVRTDDGTTIIDRRTPEQTQKKIFAPDEGEYVDFEEQ